MAGNPTEAIEDYTRAIDLEPLFAYAYYTRGLAYKKSELYELALEDYNSTIKIQSGFAMAYNNRGYLYHVHLGDKEMGCMDWQKACELGLCKNLELARANSNCE
jgi:tetratricopeptide (TPR) repeat protein